MNACSFVLIFVADVKKREKCIGYIFFFFFLGILLFCVLSLVFFVRDLKYFLYTVWRTCQQYEMCSDENEGEIVLG